MPVTQKSMLLQARFNLNMIEMGDEGEADFKNVWYVSRPIECVIIEFPLNDLFSQHRDHHNNVTNGR